MNSRTQQLGMSLLGILAIMIMVGFFAMCAIRMSPPYFEYLSVKDIMGRIVMERDLDRQSASQIRRMIETRFNTNQIYDLEVKDIEIYRKKGHTFVDASYEVRLPIFGRIDSVLKFDDLHYKLGDPEPTEARAPVKK